MPELILRPDGVLDAELQHIVVVGASLAGLSAARTLRSEGFRGRLTIVGDEVHRPYDRPPLSKKFLSTLDEHTDLGSDDVADAEWVLGTAAVRLDVTARVLHLADGRTVDYDGLVITTGTIARRLPGFGKTGVHTIRTVSDAIALRKALSDSIAHVALVGAGFIGAEVASTCLTLGIPVTLIERSDVPFSRSLGAAVGAELGRLYTSQGVNLKAGRAVTRVLGDDRVTGLTLDDGTVVKADVVILSAGAVPTTQWLESSGLPLDDGIVCDSSLSVAPRIVAAGDIAKWPNGRTGEFRRVEHWENAITSGEHAARTLLGAQEAYEPVPWVWSDQFGFKLQLVGSTRDFDEVLVDSTLDTDGKLLALYRKGDILAGACGIRRNKAVLSLRETIGQPGSWASATTDLPMAGRTA